MSRANERRSLVLSGLLVMLGSILVSEDCNRNGTDDAIDLEAGSSDCNESGVPDECELGKLFGPAIEVATAGDPWDMEPGDLDSDGDLDVAVAASHRAWIFPNDGSGTLGEPLEILLAEHPGRETYPRGLTFSDLDSDGDLDLAVVKDLFSDNLLLLSNDGKGGLTAPLAFTVPDRGSDAVSAGDLDGDSDPDLLVTTRTGLQLLLNEGPGSLGPPAMLHASANLSRGVIADFDGDGANDVAFAGGELFGIAVMENRSNADFDPPLVHSVRNTPSGILAADLNGDGAVDLVSGRSQGRFVTIAWNSGDGSFVGRLDLELAANVVAVASADLDIDGDLDLLSVDERWVLDTFKQSAGESFTTLEAIALPGQIFADLIATDMDGDGDPDPIALSHHDDRMLRVPNVGGTVSTLDCNSNGILDGCELRSGTASDCDTNGVPDACQLGEGDCNRNEIPDACDLRSGTSTDCNGNGKLDECDLGAAPELDCNGNGVLDGCELSLRDCDEDGLPDECEIALQPDLDCDADWTLDRCQWSPTLKYDGPRHIKAGDSSQDVRFGDLNGDGLLDLVVGNEGVSVSMVFGDAGKSFRVTSERAGLAPTRVAVADWNGDSALDFAAANFASHNVSIHAGRGDGTFRAPRFHRVAPEPTDILAADLDGDSDPDLVTLSAPAPFEVTESKPGTLFVLINEGASGFIAGERLVVPPCGWYLTSGDLDSDGDLDLALTGGAVEGAAKGFVLIPGRGNGTFDAPVELPLPDRSLALAAGDFDQDGATDLAAAVAPAGILILEQESGPALVVGQTHEAPFATALEAGDLDGDGRLDLIASDIYTDAVHVLGQGEGGVFLEPRRFFVSRPNATRAGDVDGDGLLDLACAHGAGPPVPEHYVSILYNRGGRDFAPAAFQVKREPAHLLATDLDGDLRMDVVTASRASRWLSMLYGDGSGGFSLIQHLEVEAVPGPMSSGDIDRDGLMDIVVAQGLQTISVMRQESVHSFTVRDSLAVEREPLALTLADATYDGVLDIIAACREAPFEHAQIYFFSGTDSGGFEPPVVRSFENGISSAAITDVDGDGRLDAVAMGRLEQASDLAGLLVCRGSGAGTFLPPVSTFLGIQGTFAPGDLDGDGTKEIVLIFPEPGRGVVLEYQGDGTYARGPEMPVGGHGASVGDLNLDGNPDVIVGGREKLLILLGDGQKSFGSPVELASHSTSFFAGVALRPVGFPEILTLEVESLVVRKSTTPPLGGKDCNRNGVLDSCELAGNDVNENGAPDECDIVQGLLRDADLDGKPDGADTLVRFHRADTNADGTLNLADPVSLLLYLFSTGDTPPCLDAADTNDDGVLGLTDAVHALVFMFRGGAVPPAPGPPPRPCGPDPEPSPELGCSSYIPCD
jgi:hypothetical protein